MAEMSVFYIRSPRPEMSHPQYLAEAAKVVLGISEETLKHGRGRTGGSRRLFIPGRPSEDSAA